MRGQRLEDGCVHSARIEDQSSREHHALSMKAQERHQSPEVLQRACMPSHVSSESRANHASECVTQSKQ